MATFNKRPSISDLRKRKPFTLEGVVEYYTSTPAYEEYHKKDQKERRQYDNKQ